LYVENAVADDTLSAGAAVVAPNIYANDNLFVGSYIELLDNGAAYFEAMYSNYKAFRIDHPLHPTSKYLMHASVESDTLKNIYDGVISLGADGTATVQMPAWFEALNGAFRYQLTAIGQSGAGLHIGRELSDNSFVIAGGVPGMKVSWQVTGIRHDPSAQSSDFLVEQDKRGDEVGRYLRPAAFGKSPELGIHGTAAKSPAAPTSSSGHRALPALQSSSLPAGVLSGSLALGTCLVAGVARFRRRRQ
jgi:hypothetical protein